MRRNDGTFAQFAKRLNDYFRILNVKSCNFKRKWRMNTPFSATVAEFGDYVATVDRALSSGLYLALIRRLSDIRVYSDKVRQIPGRRLKHFFFNVSFS